MQIMAMEMREIVRLNLMTNEVSVEVDAGENQSADVE